MSQSDSDPIDLLAQLGLSPNEAKLYVAFLRESPATPYRIAKEAGISLAKVYEVVQRLASRGFIAEVAGTEGGYVAQDPRVALAAMASAFKANAEAAAQSLEEARQRPKHQLAWNIEGQDEIVSCGRRIIAEAREAVTIAAPARLVAEWLGELEAQASRGVKVRLLSEAGASSHAAAFEWHRVSQAGSIQLLKTGVIATSDQRTVLLASANLQAESFQGAWTENKVIVAMADEFVSSLIFIEDVFANQWIPWGDAY